MIYQTAICYNCGHDMRIESINGHPKFCECLNCGQTETKESNNWNKIFQIDHITNSKEVYNKVIDQWKYMIENHGNLYFVLYEFTINNKYISKHKFRSLAAAKKFIKNLLSNKQLRLFDNI